MKDDALDALVYLMESVRKETAMARKEVWLDEIIKQCKEDLMTGKSSSLLLNVSIRSFQAGIHAGVEEYSNILEQIISEAVEEVEVEEKRSRFFGFLSALSRPILRTVNYMQWRVACWMHGVCFEHAAVLEAGPGGELCLVCCRAKTASWNPELEKHVPRPWKSGDDAATHVARAVWEQRQAGEL